MKEKYQGITYIVTAAFFFAFMRLFYLLLAGGSAAAGQISATAAYKKAPAREISVYDYSQVISACIPGMIFLNELPDKYSIIGYIIIISAAVLKWRQNMSAQENGGLHE